MLEKLKVNYEKRTTIRLNIIAVASHYLLFTVCHPSSSRQHIDNVNLTGCYLHVAAVADAFATWRCISRTKQFDGHFVTREVCLCCNMCASAKER